MTLKYLSAISRFSSSLLLIVGLLFCLGCNNASVKHAQQAISNHSTLLSLKDSLTYIATKYPAEIGIALITDKGDTLTVNNEAKYPLMSVFKLHQAISLCNLFEQQSTSLDSIVCINSSRMNPETWSPMLTDHPDNQIVLPVRELLRYTLTQSDNNASNYMFESIQSVAETDSFVATIIPRESFRLKVTEAEMWANHARCYDNYSSPLGAALLINKLFTDTTICPGNRDFICTTLKECQTGKDRIMAPLINKAGIVVAHKTGSGFREGEILSAHNDVAFVTLPDGRHYALAVLIKDFHGTESQAAMAIAEVSTAVYNTLSEI